MNRLSILSDRFSRRSHLLTVAVCALLSLPLFASEQQDGYRLLKLEGYLVKWGEQQLGTGAKISYAFADETLDFDNARNCGVLAPMKALSSRNLSFESLIKETATAFRVWERAADLSFYGLPMPETLT